MFGIEEYLFLSSCNISARMSNNYIDIFQNRLNNEEIKWYIEIFTQLILKTDPCYKNNQETAKKIITDELNDFLNKTNIKFVISKCGDKIVSVMVCIGELHGFKKYIRIAQLVVSEPEEYLSHGKRILDYIRTSYPDIIMYGFVKENNTLAIDMIKILGGKMTADLYDPSHKYIDGWHTYIYEN